MIVQCDQCKAKFKLDDAKVKAGGVKVRCSKCKHIFVVQQEGLAEEPDFDSILSGLESSAPGTQGGTAGATESVAGASGEPVSTSFAGEEGEFSFDEKGVDETPPSMSDERQEEAGALQEQGWDTEWEGKIEAPAAEGSQPVAETGEEGSSLPDVFSETEKPVGAGEFDFDEFSFDAEDTEEEGPASEASAPTTTFHEETTHFDMGNVAPGEEKEEGVPSFEDFGAAETEEGPGVKAPMEEKAEEFSFGEEFTLDQGGPEISTGGGSEDFAFPSSEASAQPPVTEAAPPEFAFGEKEPSESPSFDFGSFDFGEVAPHAPAEAQETVSTPAASGTGFVFTEDKKAPAVTAGMPFTAEDEAPLAGAARRKGSHTVPYAVLACSILVILALVAGGYYFYTEGPAALNKVGLGFMAKWFGMEASPEGKINTANLTPAFIVNKEAGEIFAISGEAVNNFKKPRASIQIKATLYGPKGEAILQKTAYCGNALSREQLTTLPPADLEKAMNNQFGDSLANLGVQPGKSIPFVVVFPSVPKEVVDYSVEVIGSTVAGQ